MTSASRARLYRWWPLLLLIAAGGLRWLVAEVRPEAGSSTLSEATGCFWAALVTLALLRRAPAKVTLRRSWQGMLAGALLIGGPLLVLVIPAPHMEGSALTMALVLTAIVVAVATAALGESEADGVAGKLWPGLAAIGGLLLILAEPSLSDPRSDVLLILAPIMAGTGAALFARQSAPARTPGTWSLTTALFGAALLFAVAAIFHHEPRHAAQLPSLLAAIASDGIVALLSVLALARLGPTRWAAQFVVIPLLILLEGLALARPILTTRWFVGIALLAVASLYLLLPQHDEAS